MSNTLRSDEQRQLIEAISSTVRTLEQIVFLSSIEYF